VIGVWLQISMNMARGPAFLYNLTEIEPPPEIPESSREF
jgi:hypothetical protein